jgi:tripartite-type tricarboxylate transporter receptor subunit TctC
MKIIAAGRSCVRLTGVGVVALMALAWLCGAGFSSAAAAKPYPERAVRIIVPFPAGSGPDQVGRVLGRGLQDALGQSFVVENRSGALGSVGATEVARSAADGYTLLLTTNTVQAANVALFKVLQYDPVKDFSPILRLITTSMMLMVRTDFPAANLREFIAYARSHPQGLTAGYGSAGTQVSIAKLKALGKFATVDVPYKGVPLAVTDVLSGQVSFTFADFAIGLAQLKGGKMKCLGVTSLRRTALAPDIPAIAEELPGFETVLWYGLMAPAGTPQEAVRLLYETSARILRSEDVSARLAAIGLDVAPLDPEQFGAYIKREVGKWTKEAQDAGIEAQ